MAAQKSRKKERAEDAAQPAEEPGGAETPSSSAKEWAKSIAIALVLFLFLRTFLVQTFVITSGSMKETLLVGDMLVVNRAALGSRIPGTGLTIPGYSAPRLGYIIVFDPPHEETIMLIKRLVGMPGDTLEMRNRVLYRNGDRMDEPYVVHQDAADGADPRMAWQRDHLVSDVDPVAYEPTRDNWGPLVIPDDRYFMLGDNREQSLDSRYWGLLERWRLEGRALFTYFSYDRESFRPFPWIREVRWGRIGGGIS
jgi:signal peptidase I